MTTMNDSPEIELLHRTWEAMTGGDFAVLEESLAEGAKWHGVDDGQLCAGRTEILDVMTRNLPGRLRGRIEETIQTGPRVLVAFRPEQPFDAGERPLDDGIAYMVVTIREGKLVELKGCADRATAQAYLAGEDVSTVPVSTVPALEGPGRPALVRQPPEQRITRLIPFVHVEDVQRSIDFYYHLGFTLASVYKYKGTPVWAELESGTAQLMVSTDGDPIDPAGQGVLFYLYSHDLAAQRAQLLAAGIDAGEIEDGSPGPRQEMRVIDPDGYELMVAQVE